MKNVRVFKLTSGEELIASTQEATTLLNESVSPNSTITISKPMMIQIQQVAPGQIGLVLVPWSLANQQIETVRLRRDAIMVEPFVPAAEVEKQYLEQTSGLKLL